MAKLTRGNMTAVLHSPGHGAGLTTNWNEEHHIDINEHGLCLLVDEGRVYEARNLLRARYPEAYLAENIPLALASVPVGLRYRVREYDGHEWVEIYNEQEWSVA